MSWSLILMLLSDHFIPTTHAAFIPMPHPVRRDIAAGQSVQSHKLSTEALLTLIGVCVAVLGIALALVQTWSSLKMGWGMGRSRRFYLYQRSRSLHTAGSAITLVGAYEDPAVPVHPAESWTHSSNGDEIPRPQRVQSCYTEQQRALMRRTHMS
ncbi:hypothetical protein AA0118_g9587 [Alternaria tenuissima]|nr:hypothetical protein AA0118_g9587 [Alternaria tenuissima]